MVLAAALDDVLQAGAGPARLAEIRAAIRAGEYRLSRAAADELRGPLRAECLPFADLWISLGGGELARLGRTLDLDNGVVARAVEVDGVPSARATWASRPAQALCVALAVEDNSVVHPEIELTSPLRVVRRYGAAMGIEIPVDGAPRHEPGVAEPLVYGGGPAAGYDPFGAVALAIDTDGQLAGNDGVYSYAARRAC